MSELLSGFIVKVNGDSKKISFKKASDLKCQIVAGRKCECKVDVNFGSESRTFTLTFWEKLDNTVQILDVQEL